MGDFHQSGIVTTLHNLTDRTTEQMESELVGFSQQRRMGLILPSLYSELQTEALPRIVETLKEVPYLNQIVIGLDRADESEYRHALEFFSVLPKTHRFTRWPIRVLITSSVKDIMRVTQMGK